MFTKIVAFSAALIPFFCWIGWNDGIRTPKEIASIICLAVIIVAGFSLYNIRKVFNKYFFAFMGWGVVTLLLSNYMVANPVPNGIVMLPSNMIAFKSLFYIVLGLLTVQSIYSSDINLKTIAKTITIVCFVMCVYSVIQLAGLDEWFRVADPNTGWIGKNLWDAIQNNLPEMAGQYSRRLVGTVGNPSILGIFLSLCIPFCLYLKSKFGYISAGFALIIILLTLSITAYITTVLSLLFIMLFYKPKWTIVLFLLFVTLLLIIPKIPQVKFMLNPTGRIEVLKESFNLLNKKAITGYGLGSFEYLVGLNPDIVAKLHNENWRQAHNEYWQCWFETGFIGLSLLLMGLFTLFKLFRKNISRDTIFTMSAFMVFLIACVTYFPLRIAPLSIYGVIILGLLVNKIGEAK